MPENNDLNIDIKCCECGRTNCDIISEFGSGCSDCVKNSSCRFDGENELFCYICPNGHIFYKGIRNGIMYITNFKEKIILPNAGNYLNCHNVKIPIIMPNFQTRLTNKALSQTTKINYLVRKRTSSRKFLNNLNINDIK